MDGVKRYPVYKSHVWELLAVINCLAPYAERRQASGKQSNLDLWLAGFLEKLELLACVMTTSGKDGVVYLQVPELNEQWLGVHIGDEDSYEAVFYRIGSTT